MTLVDCWVLRLVGDRTKQPASYHRRYRRLHWVQFTVRAVMTTRFPFIRSSYFIYVLITLSHNFLWGSSLVNHALLYFSSALPSQMPLTYSWQAKTSFRMFDGRTRRNFVRWWCQYCTTMILLAPPNSKCSIFAKWTDQRKTILLNKSLLNGNENFSNHLVRCVQYLCFCNPIIVEKSNLVSRKSKNGFFSELVHIIKS